MKEKRIENDWIFICRKCGHNLYLDEDTVRKLLKTDCPECGEEAYENWILSYLGMPCTCKVKKVTASDEEVALAILGYGPKHTLHDEVNRAAQIVSALRTSTAEKVRRETVEEARIGWVNHSTMVSQINCAVRDAYREAAKVAETTKFIRICEPHEPAEVEVKITHHGCKEIADAIRNLTNPTKERD